jgi:uncharacterized protein (TIGR03643 family)
MTKKLVTIDAVALGEVIDMALSDHVSFTAIEDLYGLTADEVKTIMRANLRPARYRSWRSRVQTFGDQRAHYKRDTFRPEKTAAQMRVANGSPGEEDSVEGIDPKEPQNRKRKSPPKRALANP